MSTIQNLLTLSDSDKKLIAETLEAEKCPPQEILRFIRICEKSGLDPISRQIYGRVQFSKIKKGQQEVWVPSLVIITGIDGFRAMAERTGEYLGQTQPEWLWCQQEDSEGPKWHDWCAPVRMQNGMLKNLPEAARVGVYRKGFPHPVYGYAAFESFAQYGKSDDKGGRRLNQFWSKMPEHQIAKCFSEDTQVLTNHGFRTFEQARNEALKTAYVAQDGGIQFCQTEPFEQDYQGEMIESNADMLNFSVTPNHDMVTTFGRVEAGALFATLGRQNGRANWRIPMCVNPMDADLEMVDDRDLKLLGYVIADGWSSSASTFHVSVSKPRKISALEVLSPKSRCVVQSNGHESNAGARVIRSNFDKLCFSFDSQRLLRFIDLKKSPNMKAFSELSGRQARIVIDAWQEFDGHTNKKTGVRRLYTSRSEYLGLAELLAVKAGYCINVPQERESDISTVPNFCFTISQSDPIKAIKPVGACPGVTMGNSSGKVWCVTVPTGVIIVRRNGFSMLCGNCAESAAFRKAFPMVYGGIYIEDEIREDDIDLEPETAQEPEPPQASTSAAKAPSAPAKVAEAPKEAAPTAGAKKQTRPRTVPPAEPPPKVNQPEEESSPFSEGEEQAPNAKTETPKPNTAAIAEEQDWFGHEIQCIKVARFKGRAVGDLTLDELEQIYDGWVAAHPEAIAANEIMKREADFITAAFKFRKAEAQ